MLYIVCSVLYSVVCCMLYVVCCIVFLDGNTTYVLVLLSKNLEDEIKGADLLAKVSLEIYNSLI